MNILKVVEFLLTVSEKLRHSENRHVGGLKFYYLQIRLNIGGMNNYSSQEYEM
jgi:hypothetical protein